MEAISAYPGTATYSLTRLLLAGSSARSAVLGRAHAENAERVERAADVQNRPGAAAGEAAGSDDGRPTGDEPSPYGPAAIFEPSEHVQATILRSEGDRQPPAAGRSGPREPTEQEQQQVRELRKRDQEVRRHEQAHKAAAGAYARGGASFEYTTGPDGQRYVVGGEVPIDLSPVQGNPRATIAKMQQIRRAALAPADPSSQDRAVAAQAAQAERQARAELNRRKSGPENTAGTTPRSSAPTAGYGATLPGRILDVTA